MARQDGARVTPAAVARHHGVEAFVNMSQMTVTQMSITETTDSPQHKLHWLAEQALSWSELPVVTVRPTVFLEGFFLLLAAASVCNADEHGRLRETPCRGIHAAVRPTTCDLRIQSAEEIRISRIVAPFA